MSGADAPAAWRLVAASACACHLAVACAADRGGDRAPGPVYEDVARILADRCAACHAGSAPAAGWDATKYLSTIACVAPSNVPATAPSDARAPLLSVLETPTHRGLVDAAERATLVRWVEAGTPAFVGAVHAPGIVDPRSDAFHGTRLRAKRWTPMLDARDPEACGLCHDGSPSRPTGVIRSAPGATACTACHTEPRGPLACSTCHGDRARAYPPRDPCFFPKDRAAAGAHAAHVEPSTERPMGLACATCHPVPGPTVIEAAHGNGRTEVVFDTARVPGEARFDRAAGACAVGCHDHGGTQPSVLWNAAAPMNCTSCHGSPPQGHFPGRCTNCHQEANAAGTALSGGPLHLNGRVDLGDGSGRCGACHGEGDDPWPRTGAHRAHAKPGLSLAIACSSCHVVPSSTFARGHLDGAVQVAFSGLAIARGAAPEWNGGTCSGVACHGAKLTDPPRVVPRWFDASGAAAACGACHGAPPTQHSPSSACDRAGCHHSEVERDAQGAPHITSAGRALHVNGAIEPAREEPQNRN